MIATDGVSSMDGDIARVDAICDLAEKYGAMVMVDDSHATGFVGKTGRGSAELRGCLDRVDGSGEVGEEPEQHQRDHGQQHRGRSTRVGRIVDRPRTRRACPSP